MNRKWFFMLPAVCKKGGFGRVVQRRHDRVVYRHFFYIAILLMVTTPVQVESFWGNQFGGSGLMEHLLNIRHGNPVGTYQVTHDPKGPTFNHDYYDPSSRQLVRLVEGAHVNQIMPNLQMAFHLHPNYKKARLKQALGEIDYTLDRIVNHPKALALSAQVAQLLGQPKLPIKYYQRALKLYPKRAMPWAQFGNFLVGLGEFEDGIERLKVAIEIDPKLAASYGWLAWAYEKNGNSELAEEYTKKAKEKGFKGKLPKRSSKE